MLLRTNLQHGKSRATRLDFEPVCFGIGFNFDSLAFAEQYSRTGNAAISRTLPLATFSSFFAAVSNAHPVKPRNRLSSKATVLELLGSNSRGKLCSSTLSKQGSFQFLRLSSEVTRQGSCFHLFS